MKKLALILFVALGWTSCVTVVESYGPPGRDGRAYFGVDYDYEAPYGYWDDNPSIPTDPFLGEYYPTHPGWFEFEFYETETDYWYGSYEVFIERGGPGMPHGEAGYDGRDTYLMLVLGPRGPYEWRKSNQSQTAEWTVNEKDHQEYTIYNNGGYIKVQMKRSNTAERPGKSNLKIRF